MDATVGKEGGDVPDVCSCNGLAEGVCQARRRINDEGFLRAQESTPCVPSDVRKGGQAEYGVLLQLRRSRCLRAALRLSRCNGLAKRPKIAA